MKDSELRGKLLKVFYDRRHNAQGWVPTSDIDVSGADTADRQMIGGVCRQLEDANLIRWKPLLGAQEGFVIGMAQITAFGVDIVEGAAPSPISISFPSIASDRIVYLDHNSKAYRDTMDSLEALERVLNEANDYGDDLEEKQEYVAEVSAARRLLQSVRVRVSILAALLGPPVTFLMKKFVDTGIGKAASAVWEKVTALVGSIF
jgi:hypothetical protein